MLFTGRIKVGGIIQMENTKHIESFIAALKEGMNKLKTEKARNEEKPSESHNCK
jgi:hypothetical protein